MSLYRNILFTLLLANVCMGCGTKPSAIDKAGINALNNQIDRLLNQGKFAEALEKSGLVLMMAEKVFNSDPEFVADTRLVHGRILNRNKKYDEAVTEFDKAVVAYAKLGGKESKIGIALSISGESMFTLGNVAEAKKRFFAANNFLKQAGLEDSVAALGTTTSMSGIAIQENRLDDAEQFLKDALLICQTESKVPPGIYCNVLNNTGEMHFLRKDYSKALDFYSRAYEMAIAKIPTSTELIEVYKKNVENAKARLMK